MIPLADLRAWTGAAASPENDALLTRLDAYAVAEVELTTGAYLGVSGTVTDRVIGDGTAVLRLPKGPATAVASVQEAWIANPEIDPVAVTAFALRAPLLYRSGGGVWARGAEYTIGYTAGYAADAYPQLYWQAVLDIVKAAYEAQSASLATDEGLQRESLGEYAYELAAGSSSLTPAAARASVAAILARLPKRIRV